MGSRWTERTPSWFLNTMLCSQSAPSTNSQILFGFVVVMPGTSVARRNDIAFERRRAMTQCERYTCARWKPRRLPHYGAIGRRVRRHDVCGASNAVPLCIGDPETVVVLYIADDSDSGSNRAWPLSNDIKTSQDIVRILRGSCLKYDSTFEGNK